MILIHDQNATDNHTQTKMEAYFASIPWITFTIFSRLSNHNFKSSSTSAVCSAVGSPSHPASFEYNVSRVGQNFKTPCDTKMRARTSSLHAESHSQLTEMVLLTTKPWIFPSVSLYADENASCIVICFSCRVLLRPAHVNSNPRVSHSNASVASLIFFASLSLSFFPSGLAFLCSSSRIAWRVFDVSGDVS